MVNPEPNSFIKKEVLFTLLVSFLIMLLIAAGLSWVYRRVEEKRAPFVKEQQERQKQELEKKLAGDVLDKFIKARIEKDEALADGYLTERAMEDKASGKFVLVDNFEDYDVLETEKLKDGEFRFLIKLYEKDGLNYIVESIVLVKILDRYYIDTIEIAG